VTDICAQWVGPRRTPQDESCGYRSAIQLPRARWKRPQKPNDLVREVVSCNAVLDGLLGKH
jgi:hypothetical protein